jgi:hypothetical protein
MRPRWLIVHRIVLATVLPVLVRIPYRLAHGFLGLMGRLDLIVLPGQARVYERVAGPGAAVVPLADP